MKKIAGIITIILLLLWGCKGKEKESYLTPEKAKEYFDMIENDCGKFTGLWGVSLYGPVMLIDEPNRKIIANEPDKQGLLKSKGGVYTGNYPGDKVLDYIAVNYGGTRYAVSILPEKENEMRIISHAIRGLFFIFRETDGIKREVISRLANPDLDRKEARVLLKLEWQALRKAIVSEDDGRTTALRDALIFRQSIRELYPANTYKENRFETIYGLATFTSWLLSSGSDEEFRSQMLGYLDRIYASQSYSSRFGFITGAMYATLLYYKGFDFRKVTADDSDLGQDVKKVYGIDLPEICRDVAGSLSICYDLAGINAEEEQRLRDIEKNVKDRMNRFMEKPVLFLELRSPYFDFGSESLQPFDTLGTVYNMVRISDNWGRLSVDKGGCLVSNNYKYIRIPARGMRQQNSHIYGDGWQLVLNNTWEITPIDNNFYLRQRPPLGSF